MFHNIILLLNFVKQSIGQISRNIHTIPQMAFQNFKGKGEFFDLEIGMHGEKLTIGIPKAWGCLDLKFPQVTDNSVFFGNT